MGTLKSNGSPQKVNLLRVSDDLVEAVDVAAPVHVVGELLYPAPGGRLPQEVLCKVLVALLHLAVQHLGQEVDSRGGGRLIVQSWDHSCTQKYTKGNDD